MARRKTKSADPIALLAVASDHEHRVRRQLRDHAVRSYYPRVLETSKRFGNVEYPLFPGYLFVWPENRWRIFRSIVGALGFVRFEEDRPALVHPRIVEELRAREGPTGFIRLGPRFQPGQSVRVKLAKNVTVPGIFSGMTPKGRAQVLLEMLGRMTETECYEKDLLAA